MSRTSELTAQLRRHGHKVTDQRRKVWETLGAANEHLTAEEIAGESGVNLASVYRALRLFVEIELVRESRLGTEDASRWELAHPDDEFHLVCARCGSVQHHGGDLVEQIRHHLAQSHQFEATSIEIGVEGLCADCNT